MIPPTPRGENQEAGGANGGTYRVITFTSTHQAMAAEDALHEASIPLDVVPAPPEVSPGCGLALRVRREDVDQAKTVLRSKEIGHGKIVEGSFSG